VHCAGIRTTAAAAAVAAAALAVANAAAAPMQMEDDESKHDADEAKQPESEPQVDADTVAADVASDDESEYDGEDGPQVEEAPDVDDAAAADDVDQVEHKERATRHARFRILKHQWKDLECGPYAKIQAPTGVAPAAKHPLTKTGEMTAHHWVNFVRCYGKYLLQQAYDSTKPEAQITLNALCRILDLLALCLRSHVTTESKQQTDELVDEVLHIFETIIPTTEHAIVVHLLLRHIPDTIRLWGPVRSYWCFPFER